MRLYNKELELLTTIYKYLDAEGERKDLSAALLGVVNRLCEQRETARKDNKERACKNRKNGYVWKSSHHPKKSKYIKEDEGNDADGEIS